MPDPFSAFDATMTWYFGNVDMDVDADAQANVMCKQNLSLVLN